MKIAVCISHRVLAEALARALNAEADIRQAVVQPRDGTLATGLRRIAPQIVLMDGYLYSLPQFALDVDTVRDTLPDARLILIGGDHGELLRSAVERGVMGILKPCATIAELLKAVRHVAAGHTWLPQDLVSGLISGKPPVRGAQTLVARLSVRQRQVFDLIGSGMATREIAEVMGVSVKTVETHRARVMQALELKRSNDLVRMAARLQSVGPAG